MASSDNKKQPWMKFFPVDWRADPRLRMCSLAARGLWIDLISYMHEGTPYGHLIIDGIVPDIDGVAALVGRPTGEVKAALAELESKLVFSRDSSGVVFSRRMVRDREKADLDHKNGKKRGNRMLRGAVPGADASPPDEGVDPPLHPPPNPQKLEARVQKDAAAARASDCGISEQAWEISSDLAEIAGHFRDPKDWPPGWLGAPGRVQTMLNEGWPHSAIIAGAKTCAARPRNSEIRTVRFFEGAIADEVARQKQPLPTGEAKNENTSRSRPHAGAGSGFASIAAKLRVAGRT